MHIQFSNGGLVQIKMSIEYVAPLDLKKIFVEILAGSTEVFTGILFILICVLAGFFRMTDRTFMIMIILSAVLLWEFIGFGLYLIVLVASGMVIFWSISRIVKY